MSSFNKVMLHGNLTADPEVRPSEKGKPVVTFSIATNRNWKNKQGETVSQTDFHRVVAFGNLGGVVSTYLKKGFPVLVSGRRSNRSYVNKEGEKRYTTEVVMEDFNFLSSRKSLAAKKEEQPQEVMA